jgi:hypothetical protein
VFRTIQQYGLVIDDRAGGPALVYNADGSYQSGGNLDIRYELGTSSSPCQRLGWPSLASLPWGQLKLIAEGNDGLANPTN